MKLLTTLLLCLLLNIALSTPLQAAPRAIDIEAMLHNSPAEAVAEQEKLRELWNLTLQQEREEERHLAQLRELRQFMDDYPQLRKHLEAQRDSSVRPPLPAVDKLDADGVDQALAEARNARRELQRQRDELAESVTAGEQANQDALNARQAQLQQARQALETLQRNGQQSTIQRAEELLASARIQTLERQLQLLDLQVLSANQRQRIAALRQILLERDLAANSELSEALEARQTELRRSSTEATIAASDRLRDSMADVPLLAAQSEHNQRLSAALADYSENLEHLQLERHRVEQRNQELSDLRSKLDEQLQWVQISRSFGESLRQRLLNLPPPYAVAALESAIVHARVDRYEYQSELEALQRNELTVMPVKVTKAADANNDVNTLDAAQQQQLDALLQDRARLLAELLSILDSSIQEQTLLTVAYARHNERAADIRQLTNEKLFWMPDIRPVDSLFTRSLGEAAHWLSAPAHWQLLTQSLHDTGFARLSVQMLAAGIMIMLWLSARRTLQRYLQQVAPLIGKVSRDKAHYSLHALLLGIVSALPAAALSWLLATTLANDGSAPLIAALNHGLAQLALPLFILVFAHGLSHPEGLLSRHFNLPHEQVCAVWHEFRSSMLLLLPALLLFSISEHLYEPAIHGTLGRGSFCWIALVLSRLSWRLHRRSIPLLLSDAERQPRSGLSIANHLLWSILISAPLLALGAALFGYLATAKTLLWQLETSVVLGAVFLLIYFLIRRWMLIQRRHLAFERAKSRRAQILLERERLQEQLERDHDLSEQTETPPNPEAVATALKEVDLDTISAQSMGLLRTALLFGFIFSLIPLWSETRTAFGFLGSIHIWQAAASGTGLAASVISLKDLVLAVFVILLTVVTARNLPGLMELSLLQHLQLAPGTGFALTTVSKYLTVLIGSISALGLIGVDWASAQWLVAALTVGLGFGLQEIFANFVSGLIILFEKPIRINDVITIRELTGTVTQIKTRATTILDWDRREIIVPNKAFITEQFINWSLSDTIIRVVLRIRVQLTADTHLVRQLIETAIADCEPALSDPEPSVFLLEITDSALIYEVRVFVSDMSQRNPMTDELHGRLLQGLRRHGIAIPHQQIDISMAAGAPS